MFANVIDFITNNSFSILTSFIALFALIQTQSQIKLSNKQFFFKIRVEKLNLLKQMINLYKNSHYIFEKLKKNKDNEPLSVECFFEDLTNILYLKDITELIHKPQNNDLRVRFLVKIEELKNSSSEMKYLFYEKKYCDYLVDFINKYVCLLLELYKYKILIDKMRNDKIPRKEKSTFFQLKKEYNEVEYRGQLFDCIQNLDKIYKKIEKEKIIEECEKLLKL